MCCSSIQHPNFRGMLKLSKRTVSLEATTAELASLRERQSILKNSFEYEVSLAREDDYLLLRAVDAKEREYLNSRQLSLQYLMTATGNLMFTYHKEEAFLIQQQRNLSVQMEATTTAPTAELTSLREQVKRLEDSLAELEDSLSGLEDALATVDRKLLVGVVVDYENEYEQFRQATLQNEISTAKTDIAAKKNEIAATNFQIAAETYKEVILLQQQGNLATTSASLQPQRRVVHRSDFVRGVMDCSHSFAD